MRQYNIVLKETPLDEGLSLQDITYMYSLLSGINAVPVEIQGEYSTALGFINLTDAEFMNYDYSVLINTITNVLNDMSNESETNTYHIPNNYGESSVYLYR